MPDTSLTDLRNRSKGASQYASLIDAVSSIRAAGRLPSSVSDTSIFGYADMVVASDPAAGAAWQNRDTDPKAWRDEIGRLGYELGSLVADIKARGGDSRPSQEMLAAADGGDRQWRDYTDKLSSQKLAPAKKAPKTYSSVDDVADGLVALGKIPDFVPRPYIVGVVYGLLNSDPTLHQAWIDYDTNAKGFEDLLPAAARALAREISNIQKGPSQATPPLPTSPRQLGRLNDSSWEAFKADYADSVGRGGA
jgi:hypothetical protein